MYVIIFSCLNLSRPRVRNMNPWRRQRRWGGIDHTLATEIDKKNTIQRNPSNKFHLWKNNTICDIWSDPKKRSRLTTSKHHSKRFLSNIFTLKSRKSIVAGCHKPNFTDWEDEKEMTKKKSKDDENCSVQKLCCF